MRRAVIGIAALGALAAHSAWAEDVRPRFRHAAHLALEGWNDLYTGCAWCHDGPRADTEPPGGKLVHTRCNAEGCHARDFEDAHTTVCLACHQERSRVPDKAAKMIAFPREATFFSEMDHARHLTGKAAARLADRCQDCHASREQRPTHASCDRAECHGDRGAPPRMTACDACHRPLLDATGARVWSGPRRRLDRCRVTADFSHAQHLERKATCGQCHLSVPAAARLGDLVATNGGRTMEKACGRCHDGKRSFSVRGSCERCHTHECVVEGP